MRLLRLLQVVGAIAVSVAAGPAWAHFDSSGQYTHKGCPGVVANRVDPINIVFYTWGTWDRALSQTQSHAGWSDTSGSDQYFVDHGNCALRHGQRANGDGLSSRYHIRVRGQHSDTTFGWTSTGDAHHEDFVTSCPGHAVDQNGPSGSGFDQGRRQLLATFDNAGHSWFETFWGNTQTLLQCDGGGASSDGWVDFIQLHQVNH